MNAEMLKKIGKIAGYVVFFLGALSTSQGVASIAKPDNPEKLGILVAVGAFFGVMFNMVQAKVLRKGVGATIGPIPIGQSFLSYLVWTLKAYTVIGSFAINWITSRAFYANILGMSGLAATACATLEIPAFEILVGPEELEKLDQIFHKLVWGAFLYTGASTAVGVVSLTQPSNEAGLFAAVAFGVLAGIVCNLVQIKVYRDPQAFIEELKGLIPDGQYEALAAIALQAAIVIGAFFFNLYTSVWAWMFLGLGAEAAVAGAFFELVMFELLQEGEGEDG